MEGKVLLGFVAILAGVSAASISGLASLDPTQISAGGQIVFPRIPGINSPIPFLSNPSVPSSPSNSSSSSVPSSPSNSSNPSIPSGPSNSSSPPIPSGSSISSSSAIPSGPSIPLVPSVINGLLSSNSPLGPVTQLVPGLSNINNLISNIPGLGSGSRNGSVTVPPFPQLPGLNQGLWIPGLSGALGEARQHLQAALNITSDLSTGLRDVVQTALDSSNPAASIGILINTIAKVYGTVAANCPLIIISHRVIAEAIRLVREVVRSVANIAVGPQNVPPF